MTWGLNLKNVERFSQKLLEDVNKTYVKPAILYESEGWHLKNLMGILQRTERSMVRAMC